MFYWALAPVASIAATVALCALFSAEHAWPTRVGITASATVALVLASRLLTFEPLGMAMLGGALAISLYLLTAHVARTREWRRKDARRDAELREIIAAEDRGDLGTYAPSRGASWRRESWFHGVAG